MTFLIKHANKFGGSKNDTYVVTESAEGALSIFQRMPGMEDEIVESIWQKSGEVVLRTTHEFVPYKD